MKRLGDLIEIIKGNKISEVFDRYHPGLYRYIQIEDLRPGSGPKYAFDRRAILADKNDVLIAWDGANAGTVGFNLEGYPGSTISILRPLSPQVYSPFLGYFLRSKFYYLQEQSTGATIPHVNRSSIDRCHNSTRQSQFTRKLANSPPSPPRTTAYRHHPRQSRPPAPPARLCS